MTVTDVHYARAILKEGHGLFYVRLHRLDPGTGDRPASYSSGIPVAITTRRAYAERVYDELVSCLRAADPETTEHDPPRFLDEIDTGDDYVDLGGEG